MFGFLGGLRGSIALRFRKLFGFSGALGAPNHYVFIGVLAPHVPWWLKNLCLYRCSGSSGALGFQNPMFFKGLLAPRRPWGLHCFHRFFFVSLIALEAPKPLCFQRCSGSQQFCVFHRLLDPRGAWELQKSMLSQVFGLLGWPGGLQTLSFHKYLGSSGALGSKTLCPRCSGSSGALGAPKSCVSQVFGLLR